MISAKDMSSGRNPLITEEPVPGWQRHEIQGEKPWYKTPVPRTVIRDAAKLRDFLEKEHGHGRMLDVDGTEFSFKRRLGLRKKKPTLDSNLPEIVNSVESTIVNGVESTIDEEATVGEIETGIHELSVVERLTRNTEVLDHKKVLSKSSKELDAFRLKDGYQTPASFDELKKQVSSSSDLREMLKVLNSETTVVDALNLMFSDTCLAEISHVDTMKGPLVDFPSSINQSLENRGVWNEDVSKSGTFYHQYGDQKRRANSPFRCFEGCHPLLNYLLCCQPGLGCFGEAEEPHFTS